MSELAADKATKISTEATEELVQHYYRALETARSEIASFFVPTAAASTNGEGVPAILYCGNAVPSAADLQTLFEKEMPPMHFEAQSIDCQIINPDTAGGTGSVTSGRNMSILVLVSGNVKVGPPKESELRGFSETLVLVPNHQSTGPRRRGKHSKDWLIQSSNFRFVV